MKVLVCCVALFLLFSTAHADDEIKGKITAIDIAAGTIGISGVKIIAKEADIKGAKSLADLKIGDNLEASGVFSGPAELTATKVKKDVLEHAEIEGKLAAVDAAARSLTISGITVKVLEDAKIKDQKDRYIRLEELTVGFPLECKGTWTAPRELTAKKVEVD